MKDEWKEALQQMKEIVGRFADGSVTPKAQWARELWQTIDNVQQQNL
jgi:hypothetical protein